MRKLPPVPSSEFEPAEEALLAELNLRLGGPGEGAHLTARLLEDVHARPADDGPRAVLADTLTEAGDPRGEFIALQLAHALGSEATWPTGRERELLRAHGVAWLGPLGPFLRDEPGLVAAAYRRGLVSRRWPKEGVDASACGHTTEGLL